MKITKTVSRGGTIRYWNEKGYLHREDGPALEYINGNKLWYINGLNHREDGADVELSDGYTEYYLNNKSYTKEGWEREIIKIRLERIKDL